MRNVNRWKSRARLIAVPAALVLIGFGPMAGADTYFVRTNGDDARSGTSALDAFATPGKAATIAVGGDLIYIGGGSYDSQIIPAASGSAGLPIAYIADTSGKQTGDSGIVVINHSGAPVVLLDAIGYTSFDGITFKGGNATVEISGGSNNITITNCVMDQSAGYGVHITGSSSCDISGSTVSGSVKDAIRMDSSGAVTITDCTIGVPTSFGVYGIVLGDITIANCKFVRTANSGHGIWVTPSNRSTPTSVTITGNDMSLRGAMFKSTGMEKGWYRSGYYWNRRFRFTYGIIVFGWAYPKVDRVEISNNQISDTFLGIYSGVNSSTKSSVVVANNTVVGSFYSIYAFNYNYSSKSSLSSVTVVNNIMDTCYFGLFAYGYRGQTPSVVGNLEHNITYYMSAFRRPFEFSMIQGDPKFVDPSIGDFSLQGGSAAIDAGVPSDAPGVDIGGRSRPVDGNNDGIAMIDIGAYELVKTPTRIRMVQWREIGAEHSR